MPKKSLKDLPVQQSIRTFIESVGEDPDAPGFVRTPQRFEEALQFILSGYNRDLEKELWSFEPKLAYKDMIILKNIHYFSICRHHLLPFFGYAHVGYIPSSKKCLGISKLARAVDIYARRLQDQESISSQLAEALMTHGEAKGVAILMEGRHLCNVARGIEKTTSIMSTCGFFGSFEKEVHLQNQFIELVKIRESI